MNAFSACCTFDIDMVDANQAWCGADELDFFTATVLPVLLDEGVDRGTAFVRLDDHVASAFGGAHRIPGIYAPHLGRLRAAGWTVGWHPHCYRQDEDGAWRQNLDEQEILAELDRFGPMARDLGLSTVRVGWAYQTNDTLAALDALGFVVDSSAIPRPRYPWENTTRDWEGVGNLPYYPSRADYRVPGAPALSILEVPMPVGAIAASTDDRAMLRYFNLAYDPDRLGPELVKWISANDLLVTITHPHELMPKPDAPETGLLRFSLDVLRRNLAAMRDTAAANDRRLRWIALDDVPALGMAAPPL